MARTGGTTGRAGGTHGAPPRQCAKCPICGKPADRALQPFCSRRCANIDLNRWLSGSYAIPGRPADQVEADSIGSKEDGDGDE